MVNCKRLLFFTNVKAPKVVSFSHFCSFSRWCDHQIVLTLISNDAWIFPAHFDTIWLHIYLIGLHLYTFIFGHKSCNMLSILNKLTFQKELQNCVTNNVFGQKVKTQQQHNKKSKIITYADARNWTRDLLHPKQMRYHCTIESTESIDCSQAI